MGTIQDITKSSILSSTATSAAKTTTTDASKSSAASSGSSTKKSTDIMGKQDFLTLLVTQLKNQDPLNPDNPTEFTAQLAQFSSLEQLTNLNDSMKGLVTSTDNSTKLSALSLIGKQITFSGSSFTYNGEPATLGYTLDGPASEVQMLIQDSNGKTIQTLSGTDLTKGNHNLTWDGLDQDGNAMPAGTYKVIVQAKGADSTGVAASPIITSEVTGVDLSNSSGAILNTKAGDIDFSKIIGVLALGNSSNSALSSNTPATEQSSSSQTTAETAAADAAAKAATSAAETVL